jgi:dUTPase
MFWFQMEVGSAPTRSHNKHSIELEAPGHFGLLMPLNQQAKKGITVLGGVIDYHGEIGLPLHNGGKQDYVRRADDPLGHLLVLPCPVIKVNGKLQQPNPSRMTKDEDT